jgi:hypothetical protein
MLLGGGIQFCNHFVKPLRIRSCVIDTLAVAEPPEGQAEGQAEAHAEERDQTENEAEDAGQTEGTGKPQDAVPLEEPRRDLSRTDGSLLLAVAAGCLIWLILDRSLPLAGIAFLAAVAALATGAFAKFFLPSQLSPGTQRFKTVAIGVLTLILALLAIPLRGHESIGQPGPSSEAPSTAATSPPATPLPATPSPTEVLFDDFNSETLADDKWTLSPLPGSDPKQLHKQIYTAGGKLHLVVSPENSATRVRAELKARFPSDWAITKISVKMTLERQRGTSTGAAYLSISSFEDRENRAWMGPDDERDLPLLGFCQRSPDACDIVDQYEISLGQEYQIEAVATQKDSNSKRHLNFHVAEHEDWEAYAPPDSGEIRSFRFVLSSNPKKDFHVTVDEIRITYI